MRVLDFKEARRHGEPGFAIEFYDITPAHPRYVMGCHWHPECELIRVESGLFRYTINGRTGTARAGDTLFVSGGMLHAGVPESCRYQCIVFDPGVLEAPGPAQVLMHDFAQGHMVPSLCLPGDDAALQACLARLFEAQRRRPAGHQLVTIGLLYQLFGLLLAGGHCQSRHQYGDGPQKCLRQLKTALEYIDRHAGGPVTLDGMAAACGLTPKYFCRLFKRMTGVTPIDYVNRQRVENACVMLATGFTRVTELAYLCGFSDSSYFIRTFRRYKGVTPRQYLQRQGTVA